MRNLKDFSQGDAVACEGRKGGEKRFMTKYVAYTAAVINDGQVRGGVVGALEGYFQEIIPDSKNYVHQFDDC